MLKPPAQNSLITLRQTTDDPMGVSKARGRRYPLSVRRQIYVPEPDVLASRQVVLGVILENDANFAPKSRSIQITQPHTGAVTCATAAAMTPNIVSSNTGYVGTCN